MASYKERLKASQQGDAQRRAYLSEPPTDYRQASADAAQGETGEDEDDKERRLKRAARKKSGSGFSAARCGCGCDAGWASRAAARVGPSEAS